MPSCAPPTAGSQSGRRGGKGESDLLPAQEIMDRMRALPSYRLNAEVAPGSDCWRPEEPTEGYSALLERYASHPKPDPMQEAPDCVVLGKGRVDGEELHLVVRSDPTNPFVLSSNPYPTTISGTMYASSNSDEVGGAQSAVVPVVIPIGVLAIPAVSAAAAKTALVVGEAVALTSVAIYWYYEGGGRERMAALLESVWQRTEEARRGFVDSVVGGVQTTWSALTAALGVWVLGFDAASQANVTPEETAEGLRAVFGDLDEPSSKMSGTLPPVAEEPNMGLPPYFTQAELDEMDAELDRHGVTDEDFFDLYVYLQAQGLLDASVDEVRSHLEEGWDQPRSPDVTKKQAERWIIIWELMFYPVNELEGQFGECSRRANAVLGYPEWPDSDLPPRWNEKGPRSQRAAQMPGANFLTGLYGPFFTDEYLANWPGIQRVPLAEYPHPQPISMWGGDPFPGYFMAAGITLVGGPKGFESRAHDFVDPREWFGSNGRFGGRGRTPPLRPNYSLYQRLLSSFPQVMRPGTDTDPYQPRWVLTEERYPDLYPNYRGLRCVPLNVTFCIENGKSVLMGFPIFHVMGELSFANNENFCIFYTNLGDQKVEVSTLFKRPLVQVRPRGDGQPTETNGVADFSPYIYPGEVAHLAGILQRGEDLVRSERWFQEVVADEVEYAFSRVHSKLIGIWPPLAQFLANLHWFPLVGRFLQWVTTYQDRVQPNKLRDGAKRWAYGGVVATTAGPRGEKRAAFTSVFREDVPFQWSKWFRRWAITWERLPYIRP